MKLNQLQHALLDYIVDDDQAVVPAVVATKKLAAKNRLAIYYNAYRSRIHEILQSDFEKLHTLAGDDVFYHWCQAYISTHSFNHYNARYISEHFPAFINTQQATKEYPAFYEMAMFEWLLAETIDSADKTPLHRHDLQSLAPEAVAQFVFSLHPSARFLTFSYNIPIIWQAIEQQQSPREVKQYQQPTAWVLWREPIKVQSTFASLSFHETLLFNAINQNLCFSDWASVLAPHLPEADISQAMATFLQKWLSCGILCRC